MPNFEIITLERKWRSYSLDARNFDDAKELWEDLYQIPCGDNEKVYSITNTDTDETVEY